MPAALPALNLIAEPGRRRATLETAREIEPRGFAGAPSWNMAPTDPLPAARCDPRLTRECAGRQRQELVQCGASRSIE